jgi:hypothetical protein
MAVVDRNPRDGDASRKTSGKSGQENAALETTGRSAADFYEHKNG